jgi:hypothetical protein
VSLVLKKVLLEQKSAVRTKVGEVIPVRTKVGEVIPDIQ